MEYPSHAREQIALEAADWFARLREAAPASAPPEQFLEWLLRSPAHVDEFLVVMRLWALAATRRTAPNP